MTDELQNELVDSQESFEEENLETENQGAELAPDSETQHEQQAEADVNQEAINKAINKKHFEARQAERERDEALKKLADIERKQQEKMAAKISDMPEAPDPFDDDYEAKLERYKTAIEQKAQYDAQQGFLREQQLQQQQLEQAKKTQEIQEKAQTYEQRAKELGISQEDMQNTGQTLISAGISEELAVALLEDKDGPIISKYLSANLNELDSLQSANPYLAGAKLSEIKQKAQALKPKTSKTPPPATKVEQQAVDPEIGSLKHAKGGSFE
jgi:hypothetical protein